MRGVFLFFGFGSWPGRAVRCRFGQCGFRAGAGRFGAVSVLAGAGRCSVGAGFILNGMIFSFLDEKRVFEGVV